MSYKSMIHNGMRIFPSLVCSLILLTGCLGEDYSGCLPPGCGIVFNYVNHTDKDTIDRFLNDVEKVDLYIYDEHEKFVQHIEKDVASLASANYRLQLDLTPGIYRVVTWGNLSEDVQMLGDYVPQQSNFYDGTIALNKVGLSHRLTPLFHGSVTTTVETNKVKTDTVSLMKNTNNIRVIVRWQDKYGKPCNHGCPQKLSLRLTDNNGAYYFDNTLAIPKRQVEYSPCFICHSDSILNKEPGNLPADTDKKYINKISDVQYNDSSVLIADFSTMRLFHNWHGANLIFERYGSGSSFPYEEFRCDLMDLIQAHPLLQSQAALDRYDNFTLDFTLECNTNTYISAGILVGRWHVVIINQDIWGQ